MSGDIRSRLIKKSIDYLLQKTEQATAVPCAQFINSLLLLLQAHVMPSHSSDLQILWKKPTPTAHFITLHCTVLDAASGKQKLLDFQGDEDDTIESLSTFIREHVAPSCYVQYSGSLVVMAFTTHIVAFILSRGRPATQEHSPHPQRLALRTSALEATYFYDGCFTAFYPPFTLARAAHSPWRTYTLHRNGVI